MWRDEPRAHGLNGRPDDAWRRDGARTPHANVARSLSRAHREDPLVIDLGGAHSVLDYEPAESTSGLFGGNSNWRGPVWLPINYLVGGLHRFHAYLGDGFKVECPTGSGVLMTLQEVAGELARRLVSIFTADEGWPAASALRR